jgi:hypothetical protein
VIGFSAVFLIIAENPNWKMLLLLALVIWSFCRAYYFASTSLRNTLTPPTNFPAYSALSNTFSFAM